jgi:predicted transport protein
MKMTERSARWLESVVANCEKNTGKSLAAWTTMARKAKVRDVKAAREWAAKQGLSIVYANGVAETLFPSNDDDDDALVDAQYAGAKAALRPIYDALVKAACALGDDVEIMPRKRQVTFSRAKSFAVVRAAAKDRVELALRLHGTKPTERLRAVPKAGTSDPSHVVGVRTAREVDREVTAWLRAAYGRAG